MTGRQASGRRVSPGVALARVALPRTVRDLGPVDVTPIQAVLDRLSERYWDVEDAGKENAFAVFHSTRHVILRFLADADDATSSYDRPAWAVLGPVIEPVLRSVVVPYGMRDPRFPKVMLAGLAPRSVIDRHRDIAAANLVTHKIHIPLSSHPDVRFEVAGEWCHLAVGRAYEVNNVRPHGADNPSDVARVHLIFEVYDAATAIAADR